MVVGAANDTRYGPYGVKLPSRHRPWVPYWGMYMVAMKAPDTIPVDKDILLRWPSMQSAADDAGELFSLIDSNREYLGRWLSWVDSLRVPEDEATWIRSRVEERVAGRGTPPLIEYRGRLAGSIGTLATEEPGLLEIGYWVAEALQGRGIVTRACAALVDCCFGAQGIGRVRIQAEPENTRSRAIPERLGFAFEGVKAHTHDDGGLHQMAVYTMAAYKWRASRYSH